MTRASRDGDGDTINTTTPWVDQNQTYTSHASHQVFLREYMTGPDGKTIATGDLLEGVRGLATWADVKAQAKAMLGIDLTDANVGNVPLLRTDPYGNFIPHPQTGFAQVIVGLGTDGVPNTSDDIVISGTPANPASLANAVLTGHAFLDDIAHAAVPVLTIATVSSRADGRQRPLATRMPTARRPASSTRADRTRPTTTSCSTPTTSRVTAAATRTSA